MLEPFAAEPDPAFYVPRPASERAVAALCAALERQTERVVLLYGPPGIGKSVVLDQVALAIRPPTVCLRVDHAGLSIDDLCAWFARELETQAIDAGRHRSWSERMRDALSRKHSERGDARSELIQQVEQVRRIDARVFALIDEADEMSATTLQGLSEIVERCAGGLRICVATSDDHEFAAFEASAEVIRYVDPLSETETREYIDSRLQRAHVGAALRSRLDPKRLQRLHRFSGGNPRRLHAELSLIRIELGAQGAVEAPLPDPPAGVGEMTSPTEEPIGASSAPRHDFAEDPTGDSVHDTLGSAADTTEIRRATAPSSSAMRLPHERAERDPSVAGSSAAASPPTEVRVVAAPSVPKIDPPTKQPRPRSGSKPFAVWKPAAWTLLVLLIGLFGWWSADPPADSPSETTPAGPVARSTDSPPDPAPPDIVEPSDLGSSSAMAPPTERPLPIPVNINADPWANIWIDGRPVGETPLGDVPLTPGEHLFRAELPSGRVIERSIEITQSQRWVYFD